jgi:proprotein convertase subtilisin/kexin type 5
VLLAGLLHQHVPVQVDTLTPELQPVNVLWFSYSTFLVCDFACKRCKTEKTRCTKCAGNRVKTPTCNCPSGYYSNNTAYCSGCDYMCSTCTASTTCTACSGNRITTPNCGCPDGTYNTSVETCLGNILNNLILTRLF